MKEEVKDIKYDFQLNSNEIHVGDKIKVRYIGIVEIVSKCETDFFTNVLNALVENKVIDHKIGDKIIVTSKDLEEFNGILIEKYEA
ncbi:MAG: hypothetical protein IJ880_16030 [Bacilli bacterium]|nr:hypothetical protein [Bacilli bacterium]